MRNVHPVVWVVAVAIACLLAFAGGARGQTPPISSNPPIIAVSVTPDKPIIGGLLHFAISVKGGPGAPGYSFTTETWTEYYEESDINSVNLVSSPVVRTTVDVSGITQQAVRNPKVLVKLPVRMDPPTNVKITGFLGGSLNYIAGLATMMAVSLPMDTTGTVSWDQVAK